MTDSPRDEVAALTARLRRLERIEQARSLLHEYAAAVDQRLVEPVVDLFHPEAVLHNPRGVFTGTEEIAGAFRQAWSLDPSHKRHFVANPGLHAESGEVVVATTHFLFLGRGPELSAIGWGRYEDRIDVSGRRPLFRSKRITVHLSTDLATGWALGPDAG